MRSRTSFQRLATVFALALFADLALAAPATTVRVQFQDGALSLVARAATAADVFEAVADKTGVRFVVDAEIKPDPITIDIDAMPLERAIRNLLTVIPQAAGHTMTYTRDGRGAPQLVQVTLFGPGKAPAGGRATVYSASGQGTVPAVPPAPDLDE